MSSGSPDTDPHEKYPTDESLGTLSPGTPARPCVRGGIIANGHTTDHAC